jgi:hypothetical protein
MHAKAPSFLEFSTGSRAGSDHGRHGRALP